MIRRPSIIAAIIKSGITTKMKILREASIFFRLYLLIFLSTIKNSKTKGVTNNNEIIRINTPSAIIDLLSIRLYA